MVLSFKSNLCFADPRENDELVYQCVAARNRYANRSGYSPDQRVFGSSNRLPRSLLSDDLLDELDAYTGSTDLATPEGGNWSALTLRAHRLGFEIFV